MWRVNFLVLLLLVCGTSGEERCPPNKIAFFCQDNWSMKICFFNEVIPIKCPLQFPYCDPKVNSCVSPEAYGGSGTRGVFNHHVPAVTNNSNVISPAIVNVTTTLTTSTNQRSITTSTLLDSIDSLNDAIITTYIKTLPAVNNNPYSPTITNDTTIVQPSTTTDLPPLMDCKHKFDTDQQCYNSTHIQYCQFKGRPYIHACPSQQICRSGKCVQDCPDEDGYYPDTKDCRVYYYCRNSQPTRYDCSDLSEDTVYDPALQRCTLGQCMLPNCSDKEIGGRVQHPMDSTTFVVCGLNGEILALERCPKYTIFNQTTEKCDFPECTQEGRIPRSETGYFDCIRLSHVNYFKFMRIQGECPYELVFNPTTEKCEKRLS